MTEYFISMIYEYGQSLGFLKCLHLLVRVCKFPVEVDKPGDLFIHRTAEAPSHLSFQIIDEISVCFYLVVYL